ncbi:basic amino acid ABC transporter substrate-binding protein [Nodosilinea sp. LEGE 07088]|uniref:basic amino acid ABC transporter substrate-binding protein n=1 Tax=Nodosilinea sp. LEGE 07088 TaxID=2777968 RepID=UPI00187F0FE0|nr:basic amino acid ABC transporter substrate-binding protein [Nodosilinea sp. LEGE 07088]MBE9140855.1 basic amino acid ABC transporter substrate-binding protein [Nodosilinea sp. LEGE 07088]
MSHANHRRQRLAPALGGLMLLLSASCSTSLLPFKASPSQARSYVGEPKTLVVSTEPAFPPFVYLADDGELAGFDVDLITEVAQRLGLEVYFAYIPFDGLIATLEAETADAAVDAITITAERDRLIDFSRPYFKSGLAIAIRCDEVGIAGLQDLAGKKIAVKLGTTGADLAAQVPDVRLITFDSAEKALTDLEKGNVDAVIKDRPTTLGMMELANLQNICLLDELLTEEYYGIALPPDSPNKPLIDATLEAMQADGTIDRLHREWFGYAPEPVPNKVY